MALFRLVLNERERLASFTESGYLRQSLRATVLVHNEGIQMCTCFVDRTSQVGRTLLADVAVAW